MNDLISRQAAIDMLKNRWKKTRNYEGIGDDIAEECELYLKQVQSAQPEIIRCRNCKFASGDSRICMKFGHSPIGELDFCAWAERRTDE